MVVQEHHRVAKGEPSVPLDMTRHGPNREEREMVESERWLRERWLRERDG
jgi:hypothetical protein